MSITRDLVARAVALRLEDVPQAALTVAKTAFLDTVAVAVAARRERVVEAVAAYVAAEGGTGAVTLWGREGGASAARAALVNGTAAHALDFDDVCWAMNAHASAVLWPAALATAESVGRSGADALLGYVAGFEAAADVGAVMGRAHYAAGWHPTSTLGTLGAAVAAAKILGLGEPAMRRAVGIACSEAAGSRMAFGTDTKPLHAGLAAQAGVTAALLAAAGVTAREDGIEAEMGFAALHEGRGPAEPRSGFALLTPGIDVKPYPSCRFTHRVIDGVLALRERRGSRALRALECTIDPFAERIVIHPRPTSGLEAKFSMQYCAAAAWLDGWPVLGTFTDERAARSDVQQLLREVEVRQGSADAERIVATYLDGSRDERIVESPRGSPANPLSAGDLAAKVHACIGDAGALPHDLFAVASTLDTRHELRWVRGLLGWSPARN